ncbi:MAG: GlxA family transcriptional regulator [Hahellaceae bacterium]|nr:GlxA family transcriptional regulator [Hahellaceae bacterium]
MKQRKHIAMIGFEQAQILDITGPMEVFSQANRCVLVAKDNPGAPAKEGFIANHEQDDRYQICLYSKDGRPFITSGGLRLTPDGALRDIPANTDTVILAGGKGTETAVAEGMITDWLKHNSHSIRRIVSICSGTFLLASAGLLNGKKATTHWSACEQLQRLFPQIKVEENAIYTQDSNVYTSAGVSTGIDLCIALVKEDYGHQMALTIAKSLVLYVHRPGGQRQYSNLLKLQTQHPGGFNELILWLEENLPQPISIDIMAERVNMSPRHFSRKFTQTFNSSPMKYLAQLRLEKARELISQPDLPIQKVAEKCGFQSTETLRRQFHQHFGISPQAYRERF